MDITSRYGMPKWMKIALITAGVMNMLGAVLFSARRISSRGKRLPAGSHPLYLSVISSWIFLFGLCYLWLGFRGRNEKLFLVIGAAGKAAFVAIALLFAARGEIPLMTALSTLPDLAFAAMFTCYLVTSTRTNRAGE